MLLCWNGEKLEAFTPERGLRQGNPLLSYLFVLCMEVLGSAITRFSGESMVGGRCWFWGDRKGSHHIFGGHCSRYFPRYSFM